MLRALQGSGQDPNAAVAAREKRRGKRNGGSRFRANFGGACFPMRSAGTWRGRCEISSYDRFCEIQRWLASTPGD